jgi:O-antigen/teichoic acid export membrane protein
MRYDLMSDEEEQPTAIELAVPRSEQEILDQPGNGQSDSTSASVSRANSTTRRGFAGRIVGGTFNYGLGQFIPKFVSLLLVPIYTRLLSPTDYGYMDNAIAFGGFLMALMRQGVPGAVARYYFDYDEGPSLRDYVTTVAWFLLGSSLVVGLVALVVCPWILGALIPGLPLPFAFLAVLSGIAYVNSELQSRLVQAREQSSYQARLNVGRASISIALAILFVVVLRYGVAGMLAAEVVSYGLLALVAIYYLRSELRGRFQRSMLRSSLAYGWAMMPADFVGGLTPLVTKGVLTGAASAAATGVLGLAIRVTQPLNLLGIAFQTAYNPIYFSVRKEDTASGLQRLAVSARNVWAAAVGCSVAAALLGPPLVVLVTPKDFHPAAPLMPILAIGFLGMMAYNLLGPEIFYRKRTWLLPVIVYGSAAVDITISVLTAETYGATGVAWASTARLLITALIAGIISCRLIRIPYPWFSLARIVVCGLLVAVLALLLRSRNPWVSVASGVTGVATYLALLWISGDPSIREIATFIGRRLRPRSAEIA